ncbi:hypothetical protein VTO73DRAFT_13792 [Trametes versicolor]
MPAHYRRSLALILTSQYSSFLFLHNPDDATRTTYTSLDTHNIGFTVISLSSMAESAIRPSWTRVDAMLVISHTSYLGLAMFARTAAYAQTHIWAGALQAGSLVFGTKIEFKNPDKLRAMEILNPRQGEDIDDVEHEYLSEYHTLAREHEELVHSDDRNDPRVFQTPRPGVGRVPQDLLPRTHVGEPAHDEEPERG